MSRLRIIDSDDHATMLDVVEVPEGHSLQMAERVGGTGYISVILSEDDKQRLIEFLQSTNHGYSQVVQSPVTDV